MPKDHKWNERVRGVKFTVKKTQYAPPNINNPLTRAHYHALND